MLNKKDLPLKLVTSTKGIKRFLYDMLTKSNYFKIASESEFKIKIIDIDRDSFFFEVFDLELKDQIPYFFIRFQPKNDTDITEAEVNVGEQDFQHYFAGWYNIVAGYNDTDLSPEAKIQKSNEHHFMDQLKIMDEDADVASFNFSQLIYIDIYLNQIAQSLKAYKIGKPECEQDEIEDLENDVQQIKNTLTNQTKNETISKISKLWAKTQIVGLELFKEIVVKYMTEVTVKLLTGN